MINNSNILERTTTTLPASSVVTNIETGAIKNVYHVRVISGPSDTYVCFAGATWVPALAADPARSGLDIPKGSITAKSATGGSLVLEISGR